MVRLHVLVLSFVALGTRAESATTQPFYGANRRELQTAVSTVDSLTSALANTDIGHIVLAPGTYILSAELSVTRSVIIEAAVAGSVVLDAQASDADGNQRRVLNINPGPSGVVQINGLNITGGFTDLVRAEETCNDPNALFRGHHMFRTCSCRAVVSESSQAQSHSTAVKCLPTQLALCARMFKTSRRALISDSRLLVCLQGGGVSVVGSATVTFESCSIIGNTADSVRAQVQFPVALLECSRVLRLCLQSGGVDVFGGTVALSSSQIYSNAGAPEVRAHVRTSSHRPSVTPV